MDSITQSNLTITNQQKILLALHNSPLSSKANAAFVTEWHQYVIPRFSTLDTQNLEFWSTHNRQRITACYTGAVDDVLEKHASYYNHRLKVDAHILQRLERQGKTFWPHQLTSWIELNTLGANAGWFFPVEISMEALLDSLENTTHKKILTRWINIQSEVTCIGYGESLVDPIIHQMTLRLDASLPLVNQFHLALNLADFFDLPSFPGQLLNILEHYHTSALAISLWLSPEGVIKFGLRIFNPSTKLMLALAMLTGLDKKTEDGIAFTYGLLEKLAWVEIQHTANGIWSEASYQVS
ncbi:hypothetical protein BKI52_20030 [marine bacterium AO1-C]|nr:hypothetical protein BKI52_20030 [marine bacterium AO1-C]